MSTRDAQYLVFFCKKVQKERQKLERFFRSDWYKILTSVDGEKLMEKIKEEMGYDS